VYLYQPAWKKSSGWPPINLYISRVSVGKAEDLQPEKNRKMSNKKNKEKKSLIMEFISGLKYII